MTQDFDPQRDVVDVGEAIVALLPDGDDLLVIGSYDRFIGRVIRVKMADIEADVGLRRFVPSEPEADEAVIVTARPTEGR